MENNIFEPNLSEDEYLQFNLDTNIVFYMAELLYNDPYFYIEAKDSLTYDYIENPYQKFPELKKFEARNDFSSKEFNDFLISMHIERVNIKELIDKNRLNPEIFKKRSNLPPILENRYLGIWKYNRKNDSFAYVNLLSIYNLIKWAKNGDVKLYLSEIVLTELRKAIVEKKNKFIEEFFKNEDFLHHILFVDDKLYNKFLKKIDEAYSRYKVNPKLQSVLDESEKEHLSDDGFLINDWLIIIMGAILGLDTLTANLRHMISNKKITSTDRSFDITDEIAGIDRSLGYSYKTYKNGIEYETGFKPIDINFAVDMISYYLAYKNRYRTRGLNSNSKVTRSGVVLEI